MIRALDSYTLGNLYELEAQGAALLPTLIGADVDRMADLLATIQGEIADRRGPDNLAAAVCGYADDGGLLAAQAHHTFPRIRGRRG